MTLAPTVQQRGILVTLFFFCPFPFFYFSSFFFLYDASQLSRWTSNHRFLREVIFFFWGGGGYIHTHIGRGALSYVYVINRRVHFVSIYRAFRAAVTVGRLQPHQMSRFKVVKLFPYIRGRQTPKKRSNT